MQHQKQFLRANRRIQSVCLSGFFGFPKNEKIKKKRQELKILENSVQQMLKAHKRKIKKAQAARQAAQQAAQQDNQDTTETDQREFKEEYKIFLEAKEELEKKRQELKEAEKKQQELKEAEKNRETIEKKRKKMKEERNKATIKGGGRRPLRFL